VSRWVCPACEREFGRAQQSHVCVPAWTVDDTFAGRPPAQRAIYDAIVEHLNGEGPFHEDAVRVGVFLKSERKFAEVRPKARGLWLDLVLPREIDDPRVSRRIRISADRVAHAVKLVSPAEFDERIRAWLTEAYGHASDR
jgi:hypothetical protein